MGFFARTKPAPADPVVWPGQLAPPSPHGQPAFTAAGAATATTVQLSSRRDAQMRVYADVPPDQAARLQADLTAAVNGIMGPPPHDHTAMTNALQRAVAAGGVKLVPPGTGPELVLRIAGTAPPAPDASSPNQFQMTIPQLIEGARLSGLSQVLATALQANPVLHQHLKKHDLAGARAAAEAAIGATLATPGVLDPAPAGGSGTTTVTVTLPA